MAHAAAFRRGAACDETGGRLPAAALFLIGQELRGFFFGRAADLADHDDRLGFRVGQEHLQHVDMFGALDRVAADAHGSRLAKAHVRGLLDRLIGQRARTRHHADAAALVDVAGHDADLAGAGGDDAGAVRPDQAGFRVDEGALDLHHVQNRNALGDADDQRDFGVNRLKDRIRGEGWGNVDHARIGAGFRHGLMHRVKDRQAEVFGAALAGRHAADHLGAIGDGLFRVEGALRAGEALADHLGVFVNQNCHDD